MLGAGQGIVDAPTNLNAVFDIRLNAMGIAPSRATLHGLTNKVLDMATANDLLFTLDLYGKPGSAFYLAFDLDIATYHVRWGNEKEDVADPSWHSIARHLRGCPALSRQGTI